MRNLFPARVFFFPNTVAQQEPSPVNSLIQDESGFINFANFEVIHAIGEGREAEVLRQDLLTNPPTVLLEELLPSATRGSSEDALVDPKVSFSDIFPTRKPPVPRKFSINIGDERLVRHINEKTSLEFDYAQNIAILRDTDPQRQVRREIHYHSDNPIPIKEQAGKDPSVRQHYFSISNTDSSARISLKKGEDAEFTTKISHEASGNIGIYIASYYDPITGSLTDLSMTLLPPEAHGNRKLPETLEDQYFVLAERSLDENMKCLSEIFTKRADIDALLPDDAILEMGFTSADVLQVYIQQMEDLARDRFPDWSDVQRKDALEATKIAFGRVVNGKYIKYFPSLRAKPEELNLVVSFISLQAFMHLPETYFRLDSEMQKRVLPYHINESVAESLASFYVREQSKSPKTTLLQFSELGTDNASFSVSVPKAKVKSTSVLEFGKSRNANGYSVMLERDDDGNFFLNVEVVGEEGYIGALIPGIISPQKFIESAVSNEYYKALYFGPQIDNTLAEKKQEVRVRDAETVNTQVAVRSTRYEVFPGGVVGWDNHEKAFIAKYTDSESGLEISERIRIIPDGRIVRGKSIRVFKGLNNGVEWEISHEQQPGAKTEKSITLRNGPAVQHIKLIYGPTRTDCNAELEYVAQKDRVLVEGLYIVDSPDRSIVLSFVPRDKTANGIPLSFDRKTQHFRALPPQALVVALKQLIESDYYVAFDTTQVEKAAGRFHRASEDHLRDIGNSAYLAAFKMISDTMEKNFEWTDRIAAICTLIARGTVEYLPLEFLDFDIVKQQELIQQALRKSAARIFAQRAQHEQDLVSTTGTLYFDLQNHETRFIPLTGKGEKVQPGHWYSYGDYKLTVLPRDGEADVIVEGKQGSHIVHATCVTEMDIERYNTLRALSEGINILDVPFPVSVRN